ncbi:MAG TPA: hypothetical protein VM368_03270 [Flavisolibacter sp.]|nr:hypothetical protein [Flavisolibacter sp.]
MKNIVTALSALVTLFLFSCQKEVSTEDPNATPGGGGSTTSTKLTRVVTKAGSDSITTAFTYNSANRISKITIDGASGGQKVDLRLTYERNAANIITKETYESSSLAQYFIDKIETIHTYDAAASRYRHSVTKVNLGIVIVRDSVVYTYDGSGKLTSLNEFLDDGSGYEPYAKEEYTYSGSNVATTKFYGFDDQVNNYVLDATETYEYDSKTNPVQFTADAIVLRTAISYAFFYSANNITKRTEVVTSPSATNVTTTTYTYNSSNRPATSTTTTGSGSRTSTYYY